MSHRCVAAFGIIAGLACTAFWMTPSPAFAQNEAQPADNGDSVEKQREEMMRLMREREAETTGQPAAAPDVAPARPARPERKSPRPRLPGRDPGAATRPAGAVPANGPDHSEILKERSADTLKVPTEEELRALRDRLKKSVTTKLAESLPAVFSGSRPSPSHTVGASTHPAAPPSTTMPVAITPPPVPTTQPAGAPPTTRPSEASPAPAPPHAVVPAVAKTQPAAPPEVGKEKDRWKIPPEKRTYFFTWQDTPLNQCCDDFARMSGLIPVGIEVIQGAKNVSQRSAEVMDFDQAMNEFNVILSQQQYWAVRQNKHLVVKKLTDWHRHVPQDRYYASVAAYRAAKLPSWEVAGVAFSCAYSTPPELVAYVLDRVPDNTVRAGTIAGSAQVMMTGPVFFVEQAIKHAQDLENAARNDPRTMRVYTVENLKASEASNILRGMVDMGAGGQRGPTPLRPPGAPGLPAPSTESRADNVDVQPQDDMKRIFIRASAEKHEKIAEALKQIDVKGEDDKRAIKEIPLKHIRPDDAIKLITPLVSTKVVAAGGAPPPPPQQIPGEQPQQFQQRLQQWQAQMQMFQQRQHGAGVGGSDACQLFADDRRGVLIVRSTEEDFAKVEDLAKKFDVPATPRDNLIIPLQYADANQMCDVIRQLVGSPMRGPGSKAFQAVTDPNGTAVVLAGEPDEMARAETLIKQLDVKRDERAKDYIIKLKNTDPEAMVSILQQKFGGSGSSGSGGYSPGYSPYGGYPSYRHRSSGGGSGGLPRFIADNESRLLLVTATPEQWPDIENLIKQFDVESEQKPRTERYALKHASAQDVAQTLQQALVGRSGLRRGSGGGESPPQFSADERTNAVLVVATEENHKVAKEIIAQLDQPGYDQLQEIKLEKADAEYVADRLKELLNVSDSGGGYFRPYGRSYGGGESAVRIIAEPLSNRLLVAAPPDKFAQAKKLAAEIDADYAKSGYEERIFTLKSAEPREVMTVLQTLYLDQDRSTGWYGSRGGGSKTGGVKITDAERSIIVRAPKAKLDKIAELIQTLDTEAAGANEVRSWHLPGADVMSVARTIEGMYRSDYRSRVRVDCTADDSSNMLFVSAPRDRMEKIAQQIETIKTNAPKELSFIVRYFPVVHAKPDDVANALSPVLEAKGAADATKRGGRMRYDYWSSRPQVTADSNTRRVMVAASEELMALAEQLIKELDVPPEGGESVVRIVQLKKGKAEDLAPVVQDAASKGGGSRSRSYFRRSFYGGYFPGMSGGGGSSESGDVTVTPIPSNNALLIRGPERIVEEAIRFAVSLDSEARPEGPVLKTYVLQYADVTDVQDTIEGMLGGISVGGYDDYDSGFGGFGSSRSRSRRGSSAGTITVSSDLANNTLLVAADYERIPQVDNLVDLKEAMAKAEKERKDKDGESGLVVTRDGVMKTYQLTTADAEDIADQLQKILDEQFGFMDSPIVRAMKFTNSVVITAKPDHLKIAESYLKNLEANWQPKTVILVKTLEGISPSQMAEFMKTYGSGALQSSPNVRPLIPRKASEDPDRMIRDREIFPTTPITTQPATQPAVIVERVRGFVPTGGLSRLRAELASLAIAQSAATQPATSPIRPPATAPAPAARKANPPPAKPPAVVRSAPASAPVTPPPIPATTSAAASSVPTPAPAVAPASEKVAAEPPKPPPPAEPAVLLAVPANADADEAGTAPPPFVPPVAGDADMMDRVSEAAAALRESGRPQVMYDDRTGLLMVIGHEKQVEALQDLMKSIQEQLGTLPTASVIRVFRLEYVDVNVAATILENMFNESATRQRNQAPGQPQNPQQPGQPGARAPQAPQARSRDSGRGEDDRGRSEEGRGRRESRDRDRDRDERDGEGGTGPRPLLHGDRIRVFPDIRTRTLVIRAHPDDFRQIAELLLKIDRPSGAEGIRIEVFQLKNLNAYEVEQALKAILKIDDRAGRRGMTRMTPGGAFPGMPGSWQGSSAMIAQLQEQMLELQGMGEGKLAINPSEQITITSDGTTNSVIVSAPEDGMKLVERLINKLEQQQVPLLVKTVKLENADVGDILPQLERVFERGAAGGGRRGGDGGEVTPSRIGAVQVAADVRTNQLVIRALKPDFEKIEPIIKELDQKIEGQLVQTFTLQYADATNLARALQETYSSPAGGRSAGKPIRISADSSTNTLFVWASEDMRAKIAKQVLELDGKGGEGYQTHQIALTQANANVVADKLTAAFGVRGGKGRSQVKITGDSASGVLFVTAPPEVFQQIEQAAKTMDTRTQLQIKSFKLTNAFAVEILEQMQSMTMQLARAVSATKSDIQLGIFAATADPRTNTLFVTGDTPTLMIAENVIKQLDVAPSNPTQQLTTYFYLTKADANSVAATINALYANVPGKAVPPPKAYAEPLTNAVFVYATQPQIDQIKLSVIEPLEKIAPGPEREILTHRLQLKYAKVDDVMTTVSSFVTQRRQALAASGVTRNILPQDLAIGISADTNTNQLLLYCTKKNLDEIKALVDTIDVEGATTQAKQTRVFPVQYANIAYVAQVLTTAFTKPGQVSERDRVTVTPEYGTQSVVMTAIPEYLAKAEKILADLDKETGQTMVTEQIPLKEARAYEVATTLTNLIAATRKVSQSTGRLPASIQAVEATNSLLVSAPKTELDQIKGMVKSLDVKPIGELERQMKPYVLEYVDLGSMIQTINAAFRSVTSKNPREAVEAFGDYGTNTLIVNATAENHKKVEDLIKTVDIETTGTRKTYPFDIRNAVVDDVFQALTTIYASKKKMVTQQATITQLRGTNKILVTCTEKEFKEISDLVAQLDVVPGHANEIEVVRLRHLSPTEASQMLTQFFTKPGAARYDATLMSDLRIMPSESTNAIVVTGRKEGIERVRALAEKIDAEAPDKVKDLRLIRVIPLKYAEPSYVAQAIVASFTKPGAQVAEIDRVTAQVEYSTSSLVVAASKDNLERIEKLIADLDKDTPNKYDRHVIKLKTAAAADVAQALTQAYVSRRSTRQGERPVTVTAEPNTNSLIVSCTETEFAGVEELVKVLDVPKNEELDRQIRTFKLTYVEPSSLAQAISQAFQTRTGSTNPRDLVTATYDYATGALIVAASKERMEKVEALVKELDQESQARRPVRVIELKNAEAADVSSSLSQMFMYGGPRMRQGEYSVKIQHLPGTNRILVQANDAQFAEIKDIVAKLDVAEFGVMEQMRVVTLNHSDANETLTIVQEFLRKSGSYSQRGALAGDVRIAASTTTNAIVISGRKEQVENVEKIVKQLDQEVEGANEPQMIALKVANASQLARTLTQVFTDAAKTRRGRAAPETVPLIIADERSNSLVVRARPSDYRLIEKMIADMDKQVAEGGGVEIVAVAEGINVTNLAQQIEKTINAGQQQRARENPGTTPLAITVGADTRTNTLMVSGSPALFPEVKRLVAQLEKMAPPGGTGVLIVPLKNVRPEDVKRVIDQIQQQRQGSRRSSADWKHSEIGRTLRHAA